MSHLPLPRQSSTAPMPPRPSGVADALAGLSLGGGPHSSRFSMSRGGLVGGHAGRRSSAYSGRPSTLSLSLSQPLVITKDPRPIREKAWQAAAIRNLIQFLVQAGFNQPVSPKTLQAPSAKDFTAIFKFLYAQLDPHYQFTKKFEEEVPIILRGLRYPFSDQISKSHLHSVGSMHAWPSLLAMLTWMVELILCCDQMDNSGAEFDEEGGTAQQQQSEKVFFQYLTKAYGVFLAGDDNYDSMDSELIESFDRKNERTVKQVEKLKNEHEVLSKEFGALRDSESPLTLAERESETLRSDIEKFKQYINHLELKKQKLQDQVAVIDEELAVKESELDKQSSEKTELAAIVDAQEISPQDVDRMTSEREQLVRTLDALAKKTEETDNLFYEKEVVVQKKIDELEKLVRAFNTMAYDLGFLATDSKDAEGVNFDLELQFNTLKADEMVSVDLQNRMKPLLLKIRSKYNATAHKHEDETIAATEHLDALAERCAEQCDELMQLEARLAKLVDQHATDREALARAQAAGAKEMEVLESEMARMRAEMGHALAGSQQRVQKAVMECDELTHKYAEVQARINGSVLAALDSIVSMKPRTTNQLIDLRDTVMAEVEECKNL